VEEDEIAYHNSAVLAVHMTVGVVLGHHKLGLHQEVVDLNNYNNLIVIITIYSRYMLYIFLLKKKPEYFYI